MFGRRVQAIMDMKGLAQGQVEQKTEFLGQKIEQSHLSRILNEKQMPSVDRAATLARALGVSLDWLAGLPKGNPGQLEPDEKHLLDLYRRLPPDGQRLMLGTMSLAAEIRTGSEERTGAEGL